MTDRGNFLLTLVQCRMMAGQARQLLQRHLPVNELFDPSTLGMVIVG